MTTLGPSRYDVEALKRDHPIHEVMARAGIELRPSGRALVGRCPFHVDGGRPNLYVYPDRGGFYCYRCGTGGDAIAFLMRLNGISFTEACERIGGLPRSNRPLPPTPTRSRTERRWDRLAPDEQVVMNTAAAIYHRALWHEPRAVMYLHNRGIPDWVIRACALGYADGHSLEGYLRRRSGLRTAQDLGLLGRSEREDRGRSVREFLAGRIVVPEIRGGQCIWMIGRTLADEARRPKYLALGGERPILGYERAAGRRAVFLCEGVFDYLTAVAWRLPAFSPCGTHLPAERLGFLARADVVYGLFDADDAGEQASARMADVLGSRWRPVPLPAGCDLNDLGSQRDGRARFFDLLAAARRAAKGRSDDAA
jgi:DNA primase